MNFKKFGGAAQTTQSIKKEVILFPNNNRAAVIRLVSDTEAAALVAALDLPSYQALLVLIGDATARDESLTSPLTQLFSRGVARAAAQADAIVIDSGVQAGVSKMIGEGSAGRGATTPLIGVAPAELVSYPGHEAAAIQLEPHHSHFVLVEGQRWGSEIPVMCDLVKELAKAKPVVVLLAGGESSAKEIVLRIVRQRLPLIVIEGSGGAADEIAAAWKQKTTLPNDPVIAEIIADGDIYFHLLSNSIAGIERLVLRELGGDQILRQAWETFATYDLNAILQQNRFHRLQLSILLVGLVGTALAIGQQVFGPRDLQQGNLLVFSVLPLAQDSKSNVEVMTRILWGSIRQLLIIIPILLTVLVTAMNRFKQGSKWLLLRAGAESIKREIYCYRTRAMPYKEEPNKPSPEQQLSKKLEDITRRTMRTDVNTAALTSYDKNRGFPPYMGGEQHSDDGFSSLTPDRYIEVRLGNQLQYFQKKSVQLERQLKVLSWLTFIMGGVGTYLAAVDQQIWIAFTTAVVAALGTYLSYRQTENTLTKYNQAATDLANIKTWWHSLSAEEQSQQGNIDSLVEHTEQVLESELDGWVQQMQNALADLRRQQEPTDGAQGQKHPPAEEEREKPKDSPLPREVKPANGPLDKVNGQGQANIQEPQPEAP